MDTQPTGTNDEAQASTDVTDETVTDDTSKEQQTEDAGTQKRIDDKETYLKALDKEIKEKEAKRKSIKSEPEDQDDVITWMALNSDDLKLVGKEFQEELAFYKSHKIPVTNSIRERALRDARTRKGVRSQEVAVTASETQGEMRKTEVVREVPSSVLEHYPDMTPERFAKYKSEFEAKKKKK